MVFSFLYLAVRALIGALVPSRRGLHVKSVWTSGSNDYCTVPTAGDAWAGFYRSTTGGASWTDSLLPGYKGDTSSQGLSSPLHQMVLGGAIAAGDPVQSFDGQGRKWVKTIGC